MSLGVVGRGPRRSIRFAFLVPALVALLLTALYPLGFSAVTSFLNWQLTRPDLGITAAGLSNYQEAFTGVGETFVSSLVRTVVFVVLAVCIEGALGLALALFLNRAFRMRGMLIALLSLPMMLTPVAVAYMWKYMYDAHAGVINVAVSALGGGHPVWLQSVNPPWLSFAAVVIVDVWQWTPFMMLLFLAGLAGVPPELAEAASCDGASRFQIARHVLIPVIRPTIVVAALIRGLTAFKEFDKIFIMTGGGPGTSTELASYHIYVDALQQFNFGETGVMSLTLSLAAIALAGAFLLVLRRRRT
jgi:multiple sugar transport system permease protein